MKRLQFTCDGCDLVEHAMLFERGSADCMLDGWIAYHILVRENDAEPYEISADLCPKCASKMRHAINPANWPSTVKPAANDQPARRAVT